MSEQQTARILIAAPKSGSGKTTVTCGIIAALKKRGLCVTSFKCGPDYIDPMFHRQVLGVRTGNLDTFFTEDAVTRELLRQGSKGMDIAVIEGVMGFYDGLGGVSSEGSACHLAQVTKTPVLLVVDAKGASVSLAAQIRGLIDYPGGDQIRAVLLNRASAGYYPRLKKLIEEKCGIPVVGYLPDLKDLAVPSRHLGLVSPEELPAFSAWIDGTAAAVEKSVDLDALLAAARQAPALPEEETEPVPKLQRKVRIAVARDRAFTFFYAENDALLEEMGAELVPFSPISDAALPENIDGLILGGGYPELFAKELSANKAMRKEIRSRVREGLPCVAECGGFLYLKKELETGDGHSEKMAGVFRGRGVPAGKLIRFGYCEAETGRGGLFGNEGTKLRGHEFHHWDTDDNGDGFTLRKPMSDKVEKAEIYTDTIAAGFPHFYYRSNPQAAFSFLEACLYHQTIRLAKERWDNITHPLDGLGRMEELVIRLCGTQSSPVPPVLDKKGVVTFCGDHGVVKRGVTQTGQDVTRIMAENFAAGNGIVSILTKAAGASSYVIDVGMNTKNYRQKQLMTGAVIDRKAARGTKDLAEGPAMTAESCRKAIDAGIEICCELKARGYTVLAAGEMGIGNTTPSGALTAILTGIDPEAVVGRGAGLSDEGFARKKEAVAEAVRRVRDNKITDAEQILAECGGYEVAGMTGLFLGAPRCGMAVVIDGVISAAAALVAVRIDPRTRRYLIASHMSQEPAMKHLMKELGLKPIIRANMHQGEGTGAVMLFPLMDMACDVYRKMGSFDKFGIIAYERDGLAEERAKKAESALKDSGSEV